MTAFPCNVGWSGKIVKSSKYRVGRAVSGKRKSGAFVSPATTEHAITRINTNERAWNRTSLRVFMAVEYSTRHTLVAFWKTPAAAQ
jgi:hypothetical protein